jgi:hypothetical protein
MSNYDVPVEHDWLGGAAQILRHNLDASDAPETDSHIAEPK